MKKLLKILLLTLLPLTAQAKDKLVSIGTGASEIVVALGAEKDIIAVDLTSIYPRRLQKLPSVGYIRSLNAENVLSMNPTHIIMEHGSGPENQVKMLKNNFKNTYVLKPAYNINDVYGRINTVAKIIGKQDKANEIIANMKQQHKMVNSKLKKVNKKVRVMALLSMSKGFMVAGGNSSLGRIVKMANGKNVFADVNNYQMVVNESVLNANPDVIIILNHSMRKKKLKDLYENKILSKTNAGKNKKIYIIDTGLMISYGPRTVDATKELAKIFYPELFK